MTPTTVVSKSNKGSNARAGQRGLITLSMEGAFSSSRDTSLDALLTAALDRFRSVIISQTIQDEALFSEPWTEEQRYNRVSSHAIEYAASDSFLNRHKLEVKRFPGGGTSAVVSPDPWLSASEKDPWQRERRKSYSR